MAVPAGDDEAAPFKVMTPPDETVAGAVMTATGGVNSAATSPLSMRGSRLRKLGDDVVTAHIADIDPDRIQGRFGAEIGVDSQQ